VKVDKQSDGYVQQLQVAQELRFVNGQQAFDCLRFHQNAALDENIESKRFTPRKALVTDGN